MDNVEFQQFVDELEVAIELKGKPAPSSRVLKTWFRILAPFSLANCLAALDVHTASNPYVPTPDSLVKTIISRDGRPTADEAWATALGSVDESATIIWTDEISQALSLGAGDLLADGDKTAARMAFRDSYTRLVGLAREASVPVNVWVSQGLDVAARRPVIEQGVAGGLLSSSRAQGLLAKGGDVRNKPFLSLVSKTLSEKDSAKRNEKFKQIKALLA